MTSVMQLSNAHKLLALLRCFLVLCKRDEIHDLSHLAGAWPITLVAGIPGPATVPVMDIYRPIELPVHHTFGLDTLVLPRLITQQ
jgi:hypothetical protein